VRLFPVFLDARPGYVSGSPDLSVLRMPLGDTSVFGRLHADVGRHAPGRVLVVTPFEPTADYLRGIQELGVPVEAVISPAGLAQRLHRFEASDWLLVRDCVSATAEPLDLGPLLADLEGPQLSARHLVAPAGTSAGTTERLLLDGEGRVVRIQRYYERMTWGFAAGVACSLVPVASMRGVRDLHVASLSELRASLASAGVPSRDFFVPGTTFNLRREAGFLGLTEKLLASESDRGRGPRVAPSARVHPTAILRGTVVLDAGVVVDEGAVLIGPVVAGHRSRIGRGATVAQCVVAPGTEVPAGAVARQRVVTAAQATAGALVDDPSPREPLGPIGTIREIDTRSPFARVYGLKAPVEAALAAAALVLLSPLLAVIAAAVRLSSPGPVFYGDRREGRAGREFRCWKFRSMAVDAHARQHELADANQVDGPQFKIQEDPRITRVGRLLRRLNLDELPQLFNVVKGEMSLVGPRPSPFRENQICVPWRDGRLSVAPGITGLWQVCRDRSDAADFHQWIYYDLLYVNHASPWLDLKILLATALTLGGRRRVPLRWLVGPADTAASPDRLAA